MARSEAAAAREHHGLSGRADGAGADAADRDARQAPHGGQRQRHRTDLVGYPALVAGAASRMASYRPGASRCRAASSRALTVACATSASTRRCSRRCRMRASFWIPGGTTTTNHVRSHLKLGGKTPAEVAGQPVLGGGMSRVFKWTLSVDGTKHIRKFIEWPSSLWG